MKKTLLAIAIFLLGIQLPAQTNWPQRGLIFRISATEMEELWQEEDATLQRFLHRTESDSLSHNYPFASLPKGHYLILSTYGEEIQWSTFSRNTHLVYLREDPKQLQVLITDSLGHPAPNAEVVLNRKRLRQQPEEGLYGRHTNQGGLLRVTIPGDTLFYEVEKLDDKPIFVRRWERFQRTRTGFILGTPVRLITGPIQYLSRAFSTGNFRIYRYPFQRQIRRLFYRGERPFKGYIATSQPIYRPGDTLKVAAYVTKPGGKPYRRPLNFTLERAGEVFHRAELAAATPGKYQYEIVLSDSLLLDQYYQMRFSTDGKSPRVLSHRFYLEDYEIDEFRLRIKAAPSFPSARQVTFTVEAEDTNGLPVSTGSVQGQLLINSISQVYSDSLLLCDTLWSFREELSNRKVIDFHPPDSIWPAAQVNAKLEVTFVSASGEQLNRHHFFNLKHAPHLPNIELVADSLILTGGRPQEQAQLLTVLENGDTLRRPVSLPAAVPFEPYGTQYILQSGEEQGRLIQYNLDEGIEVFHSWRKDSLQLLWQNEHRLPISWQLRSKKGTIYADTITDGALSLPLDERLGQVWLSYQYPWFGQIRSKEVTLTALRKALDLTLTVPEQIQPGESHNLQVEVQDYEGRGVRDAQVVAGAYNSRFGDEVPYSDTGIPYRRKLAPFVRHEYGMEALSINQRSPLTYAWYLRLQLEDFLYYRLRFPPLEGLYEYHALQSQDSAAYETAQLAPFVSLNGQTQNIYQIYVDGELAYHHHAWQDTPYSIVTKPGYRQISLRLREHEITLDSILLKAGQRLDIGLSTQHLPATGAKIRAKDPTYDPAELHLFRQQQFYLYELPTRHQSVFLSRPGKAIYQLYFRHNSRPARHFPLGLFHDKDSLVYRHTQGDHFEFTFGPGFSYELLPGRDRLYQYDAYATEAARRLPKTLPQRPVGQEALFPGDLPDLSPRKYLAASKSPERKPDSNALLTVLRQSLEVIPEALVITRDREIIAVQAMQIENWPLPPGNYTLYWLGEGTECWRKTIELPADRRMIIRPALSDLPKEEQPLWLQEALEEHRTADQPMRGSLSSMLSAYPSFRGGQFIQGTVTDENGEPLIAASILVKGTTVGTIADLDGYFELWMPYGAEGRIIVSYLGFESLELQVNRAKPVINVVMQEGVQLDEVVMIAYSTAPTTSNGAVYALHAKSSGISIVQDATTMPAAEEDAALPTEDLPDSPNNTTSLRQRFSDQAYWLPLLRTDKEGRAQARVTFPEDITGWTHFALAGDRRRLGLAQAYTQSYLPVQAQLYTPRFLVEGDQPSAIGLINNRLGQSLDLSPYLVVAEEETPLAMQSVESAVSLQLDLSKVPESADSLTVGFGFRHSRYQDGEQHPIPIYRQGVRRSNATFHLITGDTSLQTDFREEHGPVQVRISANGLDRLLEEAERLRTYPHDCMEQTASRLIALLAMREAYAFQSKRFTYDNDIQRMIRRLLKHQNSDGSWGWWPGNEGQLWITKHAMEALLLAKKAGFAEHGTYRAERYLRAALREMPEARRLEHLQFLADFGYGVGEFTDWHQLVFDSLTAAEQLCFIRLQQLSGQAVDLSPFYSLRDRSFTGQAHWGEPRASSPLHPSRNTVDQTLLAYRIAGTAGDTSTMREIQRYFLAADEQRSYNTYEMSRVLPALLPDLLPQRASTPRSLSFQLGDGLPRRAMQLPTIFEQSAEELSTIRFAPEEGQTYYVSMAQHYWDRTPSANDDGFRLQTSWQGHNNGEMALPSGKAAQLEVELRAANEAAYLMLEIPVPAGCSYSEKIFSEIPYESYREYRRDRVVIYFRQLPAGTHRLHVPLEARFPGRYTLNPAKAEMMYAPAFSGQTSMDEVIIDP